MDDETSTPTSPVASVLNLLQSVAGVIAGWLQREDVRAAITILAAEWPRINERVERFPAEVREAFQRAGFPPPCSLMSIDDYNAAVAVSAANGAEASGEYIATVCVDALAVGRSRMVSEWESNPIVARRMPVLREAIAAMLEGRYSLAVLAFVSQLEGIVADARPDPGHMTQTQYRVRLEAAAGNDELFGPLARDFFNSVFLVAFRHGELLTSDLSRHAILHGADTSFGTRRNAVRALMVFDYVQELLRPGAMLDD